MSAFLYGVGLQLKLNLRNKEIFVIYYVVPLVFFLFMGGVFISIMPDAYKTLVQSMTVFSVTMGGVLGSPTPLAEIFGSEVKKAYRAGNIPLWTAAAGNFISGFIHLFIVSLIILVSAPVLFDAAVPANLSAYFVTLVLLLVVNLCIGTVFGLFVKSASRLAMFTQFVFLPSIVLSGIMLPAEMLPEALQVVGKIFPATWCYKAMCGPVVELGTVWPVLLVTAALIVISMVKLKRLAAD